MALLIFDLDGTLIDSRADLTTGVNVMRARHNLPPLELSQVVSMVGEGKRVLVKRALPGLDNEDQVTAAAQEFSECYQQHLLDQTCLYPHVEETMTELARTHQLAVVTNKPTQAAERILESLGIKKLLSVLLGGESVPALKPAADGLLLAAQMTHADLSRTWMFGDHWTDLEAAARAGVKACFCAWGFGKMKEQKAHAILNDFSQLPCIINP